MALCAIQDLLKRRIANALTLGGAVLALLYGCMTGQTLIGASLGEAGLALSLALALTVPGYALKRLGAADVKLFILLALATDPSHVLITLAVACIGQIAFKMLFNQLFLLNVPAVNQWLERLGGFSDKQPFAPFVFLGLVASLLVLRH